MKISEFFRLRKQNDMVKLICILALTGVACFVNAIYHMGSIYHYVNLPAEYVVMGEGIVTQKSLNAFEQMEDISEVSREMELPVTIKYKGMEAMITCRVLSQEYLENVYEIEISGGTKRYYMNEAAFTELYQNLSESDASFAMEQEGQTDGNIEYSIQYSDSSEFYEEDVPVSAVYKAAKLVVVKNGMQQEEPFICTADSGSSLSKEAFTLRVLYQKHDLDGLHVDALRKMGYSIENEEAVISEEYEMKIRLLHIRYGLLSGGICLVAVLALWRLVRKYMRHV